MMIGTTYLPRTTKTIDRGIEVNVGAADCTTQDGLPFVNGVIVTTAAHDDLFSFFFFYRWASAFL
jgi:hypothetical protein